MLYIISISKKEQGQFNPSFNSDYVIILLH